jgi:hypothetical protein
VKKSTNPLWVADRFWFMILMAAHGGCVIEGLNLTQDFQDISDLDLVEPHNLPEFLKVLCEQTPAYWQKKFVDLQEKILYNKAHFADYVKQQQSIVKKGIPCPI